MRAARSRSWTTISRSPTIRWTRSLKSCSTYATTGCLALSLLRVASAGAASAVPGDAGQAERAGRPDSCRSEELPSAGVTHRPPHREHARHEWRTPLVLRHRPGSGFVPQGRSLGRPRVEQSTPRGGCFAYFAPIRRFAIRRPGLTETGSAAVGVPTATNPRRLCGVGYAADVVPGTVCTAAGRPRKGRRPRGGVGVRRPVGHGAGCASGVYDRSTSGMVSSATARSSMVTTSSFTRRPFGSPRVAATRPRSLG